MLFIIIAFQLLKHSSILVYMFIISLLSTNIDSLIHNVE